MSSLQFIIQTLQLGKQTWYFLIHLIQLFRLVGVQVIFNLTTNGSLHFREIVVDHLLNLLFGRIQLVKAHLSHLLRVWRCLDLVGLKLFLQLSNCSLLRIGIPWFFLSSLICKLLTNGFQGERPSTWAF